MCVKNLSKVALDSAAAGIEPATSSRKSDALTTAPLNHSQQKPVSQLVLYYDQQHCCGQVSVRWLSRLVDVINVEDLRYNGRKPIKRYKCHPVYVKIFFVRVEICPLFYCFQRPLG